MSGFKRQQWIQAIEKTQEFDYSSPGFDICDLHFKTQDFIQKENKIKILRSDAIPSVFVLRENNNLCAKRPHLENEAMNIPCEDCIKLRRSLHFAKEKIERLSKLNSNQICGKKLPLGNEAKKIPCEDCIKLRRSLLSAEEKIERLSKMYREQTKELKSIKKQLSKFTDSIAKEQPTWLHRLTVPVCDNNFLYHFYVFCVCEGH